MKQQHWCLAIFFVSCLFIVATAQYHNGSHVTTDEYHVVRDGYHVARDSGGTGECVLISIFVPITCPNGTCPGLTINLVLLNLNLLGDTSKCICNSGYAKNSDNLCVDIDECASPGACPVGTTCVNAPEGSFSCPCATGFKPRASPPGCDDINECDGQNNCSLLAACDNLPGSYSCECKSGYHGDGFTCTNIDECAGQNNCSMYADCTDTPGSYNCQCRDGFSGDGINCADIDECAAGKCPANSNCSNGIGTYNCTCYDGFEKQGSQCKDIDECKNGTAHCSTNANCNNLPGTFNCSCLPGYDGNGFVCTDRNECMLDHPCSPNADCANTPGNFTCSCKTGYEGDGFSCSDKDECLAGTYSCPDLTHCVNTIGSYDCPCNTGYSGSPCADINECLNATRCLVSETCVNFPGGSNCTCYNGYNQSVCQDQNYCFEVDCGTNAYCQNDVAGETYHCFCNDGYSGTPPSCSDIDECTNLTICATGSHCVNQIGSYDCVCNAGYEPYGSGCTDANECTEGTAECSAIGSKCHNIIGNYTCSCLPGFTGDGYTCNDIDECLPGGGNNCSTYAACTNTPGSFLCDCNTGFDGNGYNCTDKNECLDNPCGNFTNCTNTVGSFSCACITGYVGYPNCHDFDECLSPTVCSANETCHNTDGSFYCDCSSGYEKADGITCTDKNECVEGPNDCNMQNGTCINTLGSFACSCLPGYQGDGVQCTDINECDVYPTTACSAHAVCTNLVPNYRCDCDPGYSGNPCRDIDECSTVGANNCTVNQTCSNNPGSFSCACASGFQQIGSTCVDIDECQDHSKCANTSLCTNTVGSFECRCNYGYEGDGVNCTDIDECSVISCGDNTVCQNFVDGYNCSCAPGYHGQPPVCQLIDLCIGHTCNANSTCVSGVNTYSCVCKDGFSGDGNTCTDVDECAAGLLVCGYNAQCVNTVGNDHCVCEAGYYGDGFTCNLAPSCAQNPCGPHSTCTQQGSSISCACKSGYAGQPPLCADVDECAQSNSCSGTCFNTDGGYLCSCPSGYQSQSGTCVDIDECAQGSPCSNGACVNTPGAYTCACDVGYFLNGTTCQDIDECASINCGANSQCLNTNGGFECFCAQGYHSTASVTSFTQNCVDVDECIAGNPCLSDRTCVNTVGSFECNCKPGHTLVGNNCTVLNPCANDSDCTGNSACTYVAPGISSCMCKPGYAGSPPNCYAVTRCTTDVDCDVNSTCLTSVNYCVCKSGYTGAAPQCTDPLACVSDAECGPYQTCSNTTLGHLSCACVDGFAMVGSACVLNSPAPSVAILGPSSISTCLPFSLASSVSESGPVSVADMWWEVVNDGSLDAALFNQALLANPSNKNPTLVITQQSDVQIMKDNKQYKFQYMGKDNYNRTFVQAHAVTKVASTLPRVLLSAPNALTITASSPLTISADLTPTCNSVVAPGSWTWLVGNNVQSSTRVLNLDARSLPVGNYTITLAAQYKGSVLPNSTIALQVIHSDLVVQLAQTGNITQAVDKPLTLNASSSHDPDSNAPLSFAWACSNPGIRPECVDVNGSTLELGTGSVLQIAANTLASNIAYMFTVTAQTQDGRSSSAASLVNVQPSGALSLSIDVKFSYAASTFHLRARTNSVGKIGYQWTSPSLDLSTSPAVRSTSTTLSTLTLSYANLPGGTYTFSLAALPSGATISTVSSVSVTIPKPPTSGSCFIVPASGYALTTPFALTCQNWQSGNAGDSPNSLQYAFAYILDGQEVSLGSARFSPSIQAYLPASKNTSTLQLVARIIGSSPFSATTTFNFQVSLELPLGDLSLRQRLQDAQQQYNNSGDRSAFYQTLVTLSSVAAVQNSSDSNAFQPMLIPAFTNVADGETPSKISQFAIAQSTSSFSVLTKNLPVLNDNLAQLASHFLSNTVDSFGTLLLGSPVEDLISSISNIISISGEATNSRKRSTSSLEDVTPALRAVIGKLASISSSESVCGQSPVSISTANVQLHVAKVFFDGTVGVSDSSQATSVSLPSDLFTGQTTPECIESHIISQSPSLFNLQPNSTQQSLNTSRQVSDVQTVTVLQTDGDANGNLDETEYTFKNLPTPILIDIPIGSLASCDTTKFNCTLNCTFYNVNTQEWDTDGCTVSSVSSTHVTCACTHLTDFLVELRAGLKSLKETGDLIGDSKNIFRNLHHPWIILQVGGLWILFLVAIFFAVRRDKKIEMRTLMSSPSQVKLLRPRTLRMKFWERVKNDHRWLCIFFRTANSPYSTARRVSVVFLVLMTSLAANAIFYQQRVYKNASAGEKVLTAFWSALIIVPINMWVIFIIKRSDSVRSHRARQSRTKKYKFDATSSTLNSSTLNTSTALSITPASTISRGTSKRPSMQVELDQLGEETRDGDRDKEKEREGNREEGEEKKRTKLSSDYTSDEDSFDESENRSRKNSNADDDEDESADPKQGRRYRNSDPVCTPTFNIDFKLNHREKDEEEEPETKKSKKRCGCCKRILSVRFPWWMEIVGYIIWAGMVIGSTFIIMLYGLKFDRGILNSWFLSSWLSVVQDAFLNQPLFNFFSAVTQMVIAGNLDFLALFHVFKFWNYIKT